MGQCKVNNSQVHVMVVVSRSDPVCRRIPSFGVANRAPTFRIAAPGWPAVCRVGVTVQT